MNINFLTINDGLIASFFDYLKREDMGKPAQPHLIVGGSGSGKTFLLRKLSVMIEERLGASLRPVSIEGKMLFSTDDIWRYCASCLQIHGGSAAFEDILSWQKEHSCRVVLLVDNMQYYFNRTEGSEHFSLRGKLNRPGAPVIMATSDKVLPAFTDYNAAFFDGFKISYIRPLEMSDVQAVVAQGTDMGRLEKLLSCLPRTPRSLLVVMGILSVSNDSRTDVALLRDWISPYCQARYDECVGQVQKILSALAQMEDGGTLQDIREMTGDDNGRLSPYLKLMADKGLVDKEAKVVRGGRYTIADPLLKLWLREGRL